MIVGNGYTKDHAAITLEELRESAVLREIFNEIICLIFCLKNNLKTKT